jgi:hypothetical protein
MCEQRSVNVYAVCNDYFQVGMPNKPTKVQECDATAAPQRFSARLIKKKLSSIQILQLWII